jgi:DNA topoisomerase-2
MSSTKGSKSSKSISEKYQKKTHHEHILEIPDTYIGSVQKDTQNLYVYVDDDEEGKKIISKEIEYVPGLYKIFDEIIVNSRDQSVRTNTCKTIKVWINKPSKENDLEKTQIVVYNDGDGIDVEEHPDHKVWVPELIFGHLLTSTNYDKTEKKIVGGKNGYGAKLTNIFSKVFELETVDEERGLKYYQEFKDNMTVKGKPKVTKCKGKPYTQISFIPDYERFGLDDLTDDFISLLRKRVYDLAATTSNKVKVYYNDELLEINDFKKYIDLYYSPDDENIKKVFDVSNERWKICAVYDINKDHEAVSFVNGVCTYKGGTHVNYIVDQIVRKLDKMIKAKNKKLMIKPTQIKENITVFIDSIIVNPSFSSQTKEDLTTKSSEFGSKCDLPETFIKKLASGGMLAQIIENAKLKEQSTLAKKTDGKKTGTLRGYPKLEDANWAGGKKSEQTSIILTEGDSAKAFALAGTRVVGRDKYGIFPLKGKLLNVREATPKQLLENEEIKALKAIIGLQQGKVYSDLKSLRYGSIIILTDQDVDGSHIKGLIMNFIHYFWPSLMKYEGFIVSMPTPILKAKKNKDVVTFYTLGEYDEWKKENNDGKGWEIKYYKGLGTSSATEACECFQNFEDKVVKYKWTDDKHKNVKKTEVAPIKKSKKSKDNEDDEDNEDNVSVIASETENIDTEYQPKYTNKCEDALTLAFEKPRANDRKVWLMNYDKSNYLDNDEKEVSYCDFINRDLIHFSNYDTARSIPNMVDGNKISQRKILYATIKKNLKKEIKVAQLSGYIAEHSCYHHGEQSLIGAIINMAQNYVGSNNINLLEPSGQFGTRVDGGKDAASARYIFTRLSDITDKIIRKEDSPVLAYLDDDGTMVEPEWYCPIIPMLLVNGTKGIGTGFSTSVEQYNPKDIIANIRRKMNGKKMKEMTPWYRYFKGTVKKIEENKYEIRGIYEIIDNNTIRVTELPIGVWTLNYKEFLEDLVQAESINKENAKKKDGKKKRKKDEFLEDFKSNSDDINVDFTLYFKKGALNELIESGTLEKKLRLVTTTSTRNMYLFNEQGTIAKYKSPEDIIRAYYDVRLDLYVKRKAFILEKLKLVLELLKWKKKFIEYVIDEKILVVKQKKVNIISKLEEFSFPKLNAKSASVNYVKENNDAENNDDDDDTSSDKKKKSDGKSYNYITNLPLFSLTKEKIDELNKQYEDTKKEYNDLKNKPEIQIWQEELDELEEAYEIWEKVENEKILEAIKLQKKNGGKNGKNGKSKKKLAKSKKSSKHDDDE